MAPFPTQAGIVIVGGGAIGCAIAYHLAKRGARDVLLLERRQLTHGSTWHAAGLVGQLRSSKNLTRLMQRSAALYRTLEAETGQATGWHGVGSLRLAASAERWDELRRAATTGKGFGFELHLASPEEARRLYPLLDAKGLHGAVWVPSDGFVDPSSVTQALARGARDGGVAIREGVRVEGLVRVGRRVTHVVTDHGTIACDTIVNATGMWGAELGAMAGVQVPVCALEHQYAVTEKIAGLPADLPTLRDPDGRFYAKPEVGGLAIGGWEDSTPVFGAGGIPRDFGPELLAGDFDRFASIGEAALSRIPAFGETGIKSMINGPIPISADGEPIMGKAPGLDNFFVSCGFTSGIAAAGGAGEAMANWILEGDPGFNLFAFDLLRFGPIHSAPEFLHARATESYASYYAIAWPGHEPSSARPARTSPLHDVLLARGAVHGSKFGWERPNHFARDPSDRLERPGFRRPGWFDAVGEEHRAIRERVALVDMSSFTKVEIEGPDALAALQRVACNDMDRKPGTIVYTQFLNARGGIEADLTITRLAEDRFYLVTGSAFGPHDLAHLDDHLPRDGSVRVSDVTSGWAVVNLCGPRARDVLAAASSSDVSAATCPYMQAREIWIGHARVRALRVSYVGELGWELHMRSEDARAVHARLLRAGEAHGIADAGYRCISSLRLEKHYLYWGADITPDETPLEAGLGFCVAWRKGDFVGRAALERQKAEGVRRRLAWFDAPGDAHWHGGEAILQAGRIVGTVRSGGYGHSAGRSIACGYVPVECLAPGAGDFEVEAFGERRVVARHDRPLVDPSGARLRA
ncbi:MAG: FAD-dependent oxidoreductase [Alphaproteobacteria bacterium]|nr:FAD-dependent oxidoreductase [Alphaproteobacteria bacterium]